MFRSQGVAGFEGRAASTTSSRLTDAVAASLALGSLSLGLMVSLTVLSLRAGGAMPIPA